MLTFSLTLMQTSLAWTYNEQNHTETHTETCTQTHTFLKAPCEELLWCSLSQKTVTNTS